MPSRTSHLDAQWEPVLVSSAMRRLDRDLRQVAAADVAVCLLGESGTGKEVLARRLHERSPRRAGPFVPINCAAIPEALFESEFFGHERGAFTGATERLLGKVEAAHRGTLYLDEVGEIPLGMQAKLLRFLENRKFMRVGGSVKLAADVRLVFSTLRPLETEVRRGAFRADLYYRIQGITLDLPPLRDRAADLLPLARQFVAQLSSRHRLPPPRLSRAVLQALREHAWPGNVRELRNVIERLCILRAGRTTRVHDLPPALRAANTAETAGAAHTGAKTADAHAATRAKRSASTSPTSRFVVSLEAPLDDTLDAIIAAAVRLEGGNRSRAAERLQIGLRTVQRSLARSALLTR